MGTLHLLNLRTCSRTISSWAPATAGPWSSCTPRGSFACLFPGLSTAGHLAAAGGPRPPFRQPPSPPISLAYTELTTARHTTLCLSSFGSMAALAGSPTPWSYMFIRYVFS